jgi:prepilin signal peptidase PulO-like enzyme (type II secretory pathway)
MLKWLLVGSVVGLAVIDFRTYRLPNRFTLPLWLAGLAWHGLSPRGAGFVWSLQGAALGMLPLLWFVLRGRMGAGDLKLMAGIGAWLGGWTALHVLVISGLAGVVFDGMRRLARPTALPGSGPTQPPPADETVESIPNNPAAKQRWIPFSIPIAIGVILMVLFPDWRWPQAQRPPVPTIPQSTEQPR